jgi:hypothetical protein
LNALKNAPLLFTVNAAVTGTPVDEPSAFFGTSESRDLIDVELSVTVRIIVDQRMDEFRTL